MALTTAQEEILEKVIEAFKNGKRLIDLPDAGDADPFTLWCEVVGEDNESKKVQLAALLPYIEEEVAYGITREKADSATTWTRIGNMEYHKTLPIQSLMKGCLLDENGIVQGYLPATSWVGMTLDGSKGHVMVELPKFYWKFTETEESYTAMFSLYPLPGYTLVPKAYISAYEATVQRSTNKLCSVKNTDPDYRGGNNNADYDDTDHSFLGRPATSISLTNFRTYARNNGNAGWNGCGWNCLDYDIWKEVIWLYVLEYANNNIQAAYNAELTSEGYHQGGLGSGVTTLTATYWTNFNEQYPFIPCGYTDELGNGTGIVAYEMPESYEAALTVNVPRYRGIENFFGHVNKWMDRLLIKEVASEEAEAGFLYPVYYSPSPDLNSSTSEANYVLVGYMPPYNGAYIKEILFGVDGLTLAKEATGGSSSTFFPDCTYVYISSPADGTLRGVYVGGAANNGSSAGAFFAYATNAPSNTAASRSSRLCFHPERETATAA